MSKGKILFIVGSPNQTSQMHQVAEQLPEYDCFFSQLFSDNPIVKAFVKSKLLDSTILAGGFRQKADDYLRKHNLRNDYATAVFNNKYDLAVLCSDLLVTRKLRRLKTVFVQEGMTDPITPWGRMSRRLGLPAYMAMNTAFNGSSNICDIYCAASGGYKEQFTALGTDASRIFVTGIPNYDYVHSFLRNDFPYHDYVLVATSDIRETYQKDDREKFIRRCIEIANGRPLIFKLHPNEIKERATAEIQKLAPPGTLVFSEGNTNHMVANCQELITQYSTVVYIGIALGKKVHSYFDVGKLKRLTPVQNGGRAAVNIAEICRNYLE
ncbi:MAG TPA: hypothetical protein VGM41_10740, partial [Chitinophagaceae bacterium]